MDAADPSIDALLAAVRVQFAATLPAKIAAIDLSVARAAWDEARRDAHKLRGSAAAFGFAAMGTLAGAIEDLLRDVTAPDDAARASIAAHLAEARAEAERAAVGTP
jgi:HPt (histidine-containing phosphotransfer) domain-containing protein